MRLFSFAVAAWITLASPQAARAHAGEDHGTPAAAAGPVTADPMMEVQSDLFELVARMHGGTLILFVDRFATNEPVEGAVIEVAEGSNTAVAQPQPDGTYLARAPWLTQPGKRELLFTVTAGDDADLLTATLIMPEAAQALAMAAPGPRERLQVVLGDRRMPLVAGFGFLLGVFVTLVFQARGRMRTAMGGMALLTGVLVAGTAFAAPGHDGPEPTPAAAPAAAVAVTGSGAVGDAPRRQPDGSVIVPKDAQRLLAIRTVLAKSGEAARTVQVSGQVVADPEAAGRVQASQPGRVAAGEKGLARLGQRVEKGDVLAVVTPSIGTVERGGVQAQVAELDSAVRLAQAKLTRLTALAGSVAGREIDDARLELDGARRRRAALAPSLAQTDVLRAPVSGVIAMSNAQVGALVESATVLFEVVDPQHLWVEAILTDPSLAGQVQAASATTANGQVLRLTFVGRGLALRQGAVPLQFRIEDPPADLATGVPVTVVAELDGKETGVALPRAAVTRQGNGLPAVWDHVSAEKFVARTVRVRPLDAGRVLVLSGLPEGAPPRIVVQGAELLGQVR